MNLIAICHRCPNRQKDCAGPCVCTIDGKDIITHAEARHCPRGYFRLGIGDVVAAVLYQLGVHRAVAEWNRLTLRGCGCAKRQATMNARWAGLYDWVMEWPAMPWLFDPRRGQRG
jgi:hypothetical protein